MKFIITTLILLSSIALYAQKPKDEPVKNFEALWEEFNLHYASFELKSINWEDEYKTYRPQINENTSEKELFKVSCKMLQELNDGHVNLIAKIDDKKRYCGVAYKYHLIEEFGKLNNVKPLIKKTLEKEGFSEMSEKIGVGKIRYATSEDYGYLNVSAMEGFAVREIDKTMKRAIEAFKDKKGVIIDVRLNGGGDDKNSYRIAGRFVDKKRLGHHKKTRIEGTNEYTPLESWYLEPKGPMQFTKPVIVLTSDWSASATEIFVLAMKELPHVTVVGNRTEGIFSDMYDFKLPNGWLVTLSHQQYFSTEMKNYEGKGLEPDIKVLNYKTDEYDTILLKAIDVLEKAAQY